MKYNNTIFYNYFHLDQKYSKWIASQVASQSSMYYETAIREHIKQLGIKHVELYSFMKKHL